jgi:hypothetical protein
MLTRTDFWLYSWLWGTIMTLLGAIIFGVLRLFGYKPERNQYGYVIIIGKPGWGGISFGPFSLVSPSAGQYTKDHEFGHALQNCVFGPVMIFIGLASAIRYQYREFLHRVKKVSYYDMPDYDSIWFESQATRWGEYYRKNLKEQ